jgi:hypothetical protein
LLLLSGHTAAAGFTSHDVFDVVFLQTQKQRTQISLNEKLNFKFTCLNLSLTFKFCKPQFVSPTQFDFCIRRLQPASVLVFNPRSLSSTCVIVQIQFFEKLLWLKKTPGEEEEEIKED